MESGEIKALRIIFEKGGKASINALARAMRISSEYARIIAIDIGRRDYIDLTSDGICKITEKGKELLKSRGILDKIDEEEKRKKEAEQAKNEEGEEKGKPKIITLNY
jgi:predicted Fe-Mo cluster-binding NifX family protein